MRQHLGEVFVFFLFSRRSRTRKSRGHLSGFRTIVTYFSWLFSSLHLSTCPSNLVFLFLVGKDEEGQGGDDQTVRPLAVISWRSPPIGTLPRSRKDTLFRKGKSRTERSDRKRSPFLSRPGAQCAQSVGLSSSPPCENRVCDVCELQVKCGARYGLAMDVAARASGQCSGEILLCWRKCL
jgi:hypothetical protein